MNTCIAEGCPKDIEVKKHSLCRSHYNKLYYHGKLPKEVGNPACKACGGPVPQPASTGPRKSYCTQECKRQANQASARERDRVKRTEDRLTRTPRQCGWCAKPLPQGHIGQQRYHTECAKAWGKASHQADNPNRQCAHDDCDRPTRARGLCSMHHRRWARAEGLLKPEPWDDRRKANYHRRRAQKMALPSEAVVPSKVYDRDDWECGICGVAVDKDVTWPDPLSPSLDHVIPLARGGHHTYANTQLAHLVCNIRKSDKMLDAIPPQT